MDNLTPEQRKKCMKAIKSKDTKVEILLRKKLWNLGYRYTKNNNKLIGKPDIVLSKYKTAIFCDGSFWHGYDWDNRKHHIKTRPEYWIPKIEKNIQNDIKNTEQLQLSGWTVLRFWDFEIKKELDKCIEKIIYCLEIKEQNFKK